MEFEAYLASKRIDRVLFSSAEPDVFASWKNDFEQMHPNSFTVRYLNLINPIRRKYQLRVVESPKPAPAPKSPAVKLPMARPQTTPSTSDAASPAIPKASPKIPRPGMPKPVVKLASQVQQVNTATGQPGSPETNQPVSSPVVKTSETDQQTEADKRPGESNSERAHETGVTPKESEGLARPGSVQPDAGTLDPEQAAPAPADAKVPIAKPAKPVIPRPVIKPKPKTN